MNRAIRSSNQFLVRVISLADTQDMSVYQNLKLTCFYELVHRILDPPKTKQNKNMYTLFSSATAGLWASMGRAVTVSVSMFFTGE